MKIEAIQFIVTATHVLQEAKRAGKHIVTAGYERPFRLSGEWRGFTHKTGQTVDVDLSLIRLNDVEWKELMRRFNAVSLGDLGDLPTEVDYLAVIGYPHSKNKPTPKSRYRLAPRCTYVASSMLEPMSSDITNGKHEEVHFSVSADTRRKDVEAGDIALPNPQGMSGGGVWNLRVRETLSGTGGPQLVGIGIEYDRERHSFVCTRIAPVLAMIKDLQG